MKTIPPPLKEAFERLNRAWIEKNFRIEPSDIESFQNIDRIEESGGAILFAFYGHTVVGTVALKKISDTEFELCKFAVDIQSQGKGMGNILIDAILEKAKNLGAKRVFLEDNTKLEASIHLYRKKKFKEVADFHSDYERVDIVMDIYF